ncbi:MAG: fatty acid desaturase family protein [Flammeovirgaceae bacterium]
MQIKKEWNEKLALVQWHDLVKLSPIQRFIELTVSLPWLILSLLAAYFEWYVIALPSSFIFFLAGLRQVHNGFHGALGVSKQSTNWILWLNSILMFGAMHAVKYNHLLHHRHCLQENDIEGKSARMSAIKALCYGPIFPLELHYHALKNGDDETKKWVRFELGAIALCYGVIFWIGPPLLVYHAIAMIIGECLTAFFAVWTVHHHCDDDMPSRTLRGGWKNFLTYHMFYHMEHHLFPKVPTINLPKLAQRIDQEIPELKKKQVF